jgi:predicted dehydrogenase
MFELGSHLIDQMVRLMGRPQRVSPFLRKHGKADDQFADNTIAVLEWPGALGLLVGASLAVDGNRFRSFEVAGTKGTLTLAPLEPGDLYLDVNRKRERIPIPRYSRYEDDLKEFAAAVRKGTPLRVTPEEDLAVQEVLIQASGMKG